MLTSGCLVPAAERVARETLNEVRRLASSGGAPRCFFLSLLAHTSLPGTIFVDMSSLFEHAYVVVPFFSFSLSVHLPRLESLSFRCIRAVACAQSMSNLLVMISCCYSRSSSWTNLPQPERWPPPAQPLRQLRFCLLWRPWAQRVRAFRDSVRPRRLAAAAAAAAAGASALCAPHLGLRV